MLNISERRACQAHGQHRWMQREAPRGRDDDLTADLIELTRQYGRYGYRKISALLRGAGWVVNHKRVERTHDGRKFLPLDVVDEFTHPCLAIRISRKLKSTDVIDVLSDLFILRGVPGHIRSDNGPEYIAKVVQK